MKTEDLDIVFPLKEQDDNEELRYSLRSIAQNMPHRKIFLAGFKPDWVQNVEFISVEEPDGIKYGKSAANTRAACLDPRVSDNFILFNDDFFVMKPVDRLDPVHRGSLWEFLKIYRKLNTSYRAYTNGIVRAIKILQSLHVKGILRSYELHIPMVFNKSKRLKIYELQDQWPAENTALHTNTLYGNIFQIGGVKVKDVKINRPNKAPDPDSKFLSCGDLAWQSGRVAKYVRSQFPDKCKFEK